MNKENGCLIEHSCTSFNLLIETAFDEIQPMFQETSDFESQTLSKLLPSLDFWNYSDFDSMNKLYEISYESYFVGLKLSIDTLRKEMKLVVTDKHKFVIQDESISLRVW